MYTCLKMKKNKTTTVKLHRIKVCEECWERLGMGKTERHPKDMAFLIIKVAAMLKSI